MGNLKDVLDKAGFRESTEDSGCCGCCENCEIVPSTGESETYGCCHLLSIKFNNADIPDDYVCNHYEVMSAIRELADMIIKGKSLI